MDSTQIFSGLADEYTVGRPTYAEAFIDSLYSQHGVSQQSVVADIGSGTGKFAKQLLDKGSFVYGVEPNDDMRDIAVKELGGYENFCAVAGSAAETTLADGSVDFVTTAQAFHWFDVSLFKQECQRILRKEGMVFLVWNMRDMSNVVQQQSFEIFSQFCPRFTGFSGGMKKDDTRIKQFFNAKYEYVEFDNPLFYDKNKFISRCLSGSYSLKEGDKNYQKYLWELSNLFDQHATNDMLTMANKTVAYWGKVI